MVSSSLTCGKPLHSYWERSTYVPQPTTRANGLVERLHRQLKGALKGHPNPENWTDALPLILLGIRTTLREDIKSTVTELVYGTTLRLPGAYFSPQSAKDSPDPTSYVSALRSRMHLLKATPPRPVHADVDTTATLRESTHVFVRRDCVRKPLQPSYDGPYRVVSRATKHFTLDIDGRQDTVAIDRLKPADSDTHPSTHTSTATPIPQSTEPPMREETATPRRTTRSGRRVHWPAHLADYFAH